MIPAPTPTDETERLADLRALKLLDTPPEDRFDRIVRLANRVLDAPIAYIALVDQDRQWFKARNDVAGPYCPLPMTQTDRSISFCGHTILHDESLIVPDARSDERFKDNPMVTGEPGIRFYAGHPLKGPQGHNVGTLCVADTRPREFSETQTMLLKQLAELAEYELNLLDLVATQYDLIDTKNQLVATQEHLSRELAEAAAYVEATIPEPTAFDEVAIDHRFIASSQLGGDLYGYYLLDEEHLAVYLLDATGHGVASSLLAVSASTAIRRQTLPETNFFDPADVIDSLNLAFPIEDNNGRFFTIWYGVLHLPSRMLAYSTAGHHPALVYNPQLHPDRETPTQLGEPALMIGVDPETTFETRHVTLEPGDRLYLFSDGAFELFDEDRKILGINGLSQELFAAQALPDARRLDVILDNLRAYQRLETFHDDYSMLELTVSV